MKTEKDIYSEIIPIFHRYKNALCFIEECLLWQSTFLSVTFNVFCHLAFWSLLYFPFSYLFLFSLVLIFYVSYEMITSLFNLRLFSVRDHDPKYLNPQILAIHVSKLLSVILGISNKLIRFRNTTPIGFYLFSIAVGVSSIKASSYMNGVTIAYFLLNLILIIPMFKYHQIHVVIWEFLKPILVMLEEEFDKKQFEDPKVGEAEEILIASQMVYNGKPISDETKTEFYEWVDWMVTGDLKSNKWSFDKETEISFISQEEGPTRNDFLEKSRLKNDETLHFIASDMMNEDVSYWIDKFIEGREDEKDLRPMKKALKQPDSFDTSKMNTEDILDSDEFGEFDESMLDL